jgi:hypothetical protein
MVTLGQSGILKAKYCGIRTYDERIPRRRRSLLARRVEGLLAHGAIVSGWIFSVKVVRHRNREFGCGNLWKTAGVRANAGGSPFFSGVRGWATQVCSGVGQPSRD